MYRLSESSDDDPQSMEVITPPKKWKRRREDEEQYSVDSKRACQSSPEKPTYFQNFSKKASSEDEDKSDDDDDDEAPSFSSGTKRTFEVQDAMPGDNAYGKAQEMMKKLGYKSGEGLGKNRQGRVEPIGLSTQQGRRGVGFVPVSQGKPYCGPGWDASKEVVTVHEVPIWAKESPFEQMNRDELDEGTEIGPKKLTIDDEREFCDHRILDDILSLKTLFDQIPKEKLRTLVGRCNLYESIEKVFFMNRAALKMANLDCAFDYMFTNPKTEEGAPIVRSSELLYFADVCAGPGGFSEYVLWRKKWRAKGFGFTLRGACDFKLSNMLAAPIESFFPFYGEKDDGDIFNPVNLTSLKNHVLKHTEDKGVHFLMGDGGFSVEGEENIQEIKSKQLYLCQCIAALSLVREGGHFVVKLFDTFTEFSVGLIYLMYRSFKRICIHKPVTSRPANSERYLICKWKRIDSDVIERYLFHINETLWKFNLEKSTKDITKLVPLGVIRADEDFYKYICDSNNRIGDLQIVNLLKINENHINGELLDTLMYDNDTLTHEAKRADVRRRCLELWEIPDDKRKTAKKMTPSEQVNSLLSRMKAKDSYVTEEIMKRSLSYSPTFAMRDNDFTKDNKEIINSVYDWYYMYCNNTRDSKFSFYLGLGGFDVYRWDVRAWIREKGMSLPEGTLIYAEDVEENRGEGRGIHKSHSLHIIDAFSLGSELIFDHCLKWRNEYIKLFCKSLSIPMPNRTEHITFALRCKPLYKLSEIRRNLGRLTERTLKNGNVGWTTAVPNTQDNSDMYFNVECLMFFKFTKEPWQTHFSKSNSCEYFFNRQTGESDYKTRLGCFHHTFHSLLSSFRCQHKREGERFIGGLDVLLKKC